MEYMLLLILGTVLIVTGIFNIKGNVSTIHRYNRRRVSKEDAPKYGKTMGLGTLIMGASMAATAILQVIFHLEAIFYLLATGVAIGLSIMVYAQFKYNKGIF